VEVLAGISRKEAPKVKKEEARQEKIEGATHNEGGPIQGIKICRLEELQERSLANAKPLKEFEQMDWMPINFEEIFNKRRPYPNQKESARAIEFNFPKERHLGYELDKESAREIIKGFSMGRRGRSGSHCRSKEDHGSEAGGLALCTTSRGVHDRSRPCQRYLSSDT
jgi:hypothetical protein